MYEKGHWPSRFNPDHKWTFTILKQASWSPCSVNVVDLIAHFGHEALPVKIERLDAFFRNLGPEMDETCTPVAECGIEFILQKQQGTRQKPA